MSGGSETTKASQKTTKKCCPAAVMREVREVREERESELWIALCVF